MDRARVLRRIAPAAEPVGVVGAIIPWNSPLNAHIATSLGVTDWGDPESDEDYLA